MPASSRPSNRARATAAIGVGAAAATLSLYLRLSGTSALSDFDVMWLAGRALLSGRDPYQFVHGHFLWPMNYPLTAAVVAMPLSVLPQVMAAAVWIGTGFALLAYPLTANEWWPLLCLANYPAVEAAQLAQWSPLLTTIGLVPSLAFLAVAKPTTGGAIVLAYGHQTFRRRNALRWIAISAGLVVLSMAIRPSWVLEWLTTVRGSREFTPLILRPGGIVLLLSLAKWRRPEARLVALLALVPQAAGAYGALPLILALSTKWEAFLYGWISLAAVPLMVPAIGNGAAYEAAAAHNAPIFIATLYVPILIMVLRRPNVGALPPVLERMASRAPAWLAGRGIDPEGT